MLTAAFPDATSASAWIYPEHRNIAVAGVQKLEPQDREALQALCGPEAMSTLEQIPHNADMVAYLREAVDVFRRSYSGKPRRRAAARATTAARTCRPLRCRRPESCRFRLLSRSWHSLARSASH